MDNPRFKSDYLGVLETEKARQKIIIDYIKYSYDESSSDSNTSSPSLPSAKRMKEDESGSNFTCETHDTFWNCFNEVAKDNSSDSREQEKQNLIANDIDFSTDFQKEEVINSYVSRLLILISHVIGLKWQVRNDSVLTVDRGAVIVANHQSAIDIIGLYFVWRVAKKCIIVSKKAMMYVFTCGICMYLCGSIFIDRNNPKEAHEQLQVESKKTFKNKTKICIFPEGTRNKDLTKLLRFRKGAFAIAIASQVPIIPVVFSPYYFINHEKQIFNNGHVIIQCLEAVPTEGLTMDDLPDLMDRIYNIMNRTYNELLLEVKSTLPPNYPMALQNSENTA